MGTDITMNNLKYMCITSAPRKGRNKGYSMNVHIVPSACMAVTPCRQNPGKEQKSMLCMAAVRSTEISNTAGKASRVKKHTELLGSEMTLAQEITMPVSSGWNCDSDCS